MKIGICSDHAGFEYKTRLIAWLEDGGNEVVNFGTDSADSMDYPDVAHPLAKAVTKGDVQCGIAMCGTGNGMSFCLNKHIGIRAGLAWSVEIGKLLKQHNNANILALGGRTTDAGLAVKIVDQWLDTEFEGGRHQRRINMLDQM